MSSSLTGPIVGCIMGNLCGGLIINAGFNRFKRAMLVEDTPTSFSASAAQGTVELQGYVWPSETVLSPFAGIESVYFSLKMEVYRCDAFGKFRWHRVAEVSNFKPFYLVDKSGLTLIGEVQTEFEVVSEVLSWSKLNTNQKSLVVNSLEQSGNRGYLDLNLNSSTHRIRVSESHILVGSPLYAYGRFVSDESLSANAPPPAQGLREFYNKVRGVKLEKGPMPAAAQTAQTIIKNAKNEGSDLKVYGMLLGVDEGPLYLADGWQNQVLMRKGGWLKNYLIIVCGVLLIAAVNVTGCKQLQDISRSSNNFKKAP